MSEDRGMLILGRTEQERVAIVLEDGREIDVVICRIQRHSVRIGIRAPRSITILREEIEDNGRDAARAALGRV